MPEGSDMRKTAGAFVKDGVLLSLLGRKCLFGSWFWRLQFMVNWIPCFGACGKAEHHGGLLWLRKPLIS